MRKLSEIKGEDALDVLSDLIDPLYEFSTDQKFLSLIRKGDYKTAIQHVIKTHKKALLTALAVIEGENPDDYDPPLIRLPAMLVELFNDPELISLFPSQQTVTSSGSAMGNTEAQET